MKKTGILNRDISEVVASMGHSDMLTIADAGLPIPDGVRRIDLALRPGVPGFLETVRTVLSELKVERIIVAEEIAAISPQIQEELKTLLSDVPWQVVPNDELKAISARTKAVVRTGEFTPYANVILIAGVVFP